MPTPSTTVSEYCGLLARSKLISEEEVAAQFERWQADTQGTDADVDSFRDFLVARHRLTAYQAALVQRGRADGFFIGGYVVQDRVGKGQTAGVYKAVHDSGQVVAVKVLPGSKAKNPHLLGRFQREGRLLTQLNHPNVVRAFQVGSGGGVHFIAMEYLEGETLDDVLTRRNKLPPGESARVVFQALHGLQHLHERRMVHRDLKPANLMATPGGGDTTLTATIRILDIGLGRELFDESSSSTQDLNLTAEGAILGTPDYLAPEQARDARVADIRSDVYSLGCVLYHLLAGRPPFVEKNVMAAMVKHASETPPPVSKFTPGVPPGLQVVLNRMLAKDPAGRYATPAEAADALRPLLPANAPGATGSQVLPAYEQWLRTETDMPVPAEVVAEVPRPKPNGKSGAVRIGPGRTTDPEVEKPASGPSGPAAGKVPRPTGLGGPMSGKIKRPPGLTAPVAGVAKPSVSAPRPAPPTLKPPSVPGRPSPLVGSRPSVAPLPADADIDVELVALPGVRLPEPVDVLGSVANAPPARPLWELDRRDFIMLAVGAGGTLAAIVTGLMLAKVNADKLRGGEQQQKENQPGS